jgi:hypothetical protein
VITAAALLALTLAAGDPPAAGAATLLPADGAVAGCTRSGAVETYNGAELYGLIDGGAEAFLELGFERTTLQRYRFAGQEVTLELYHMSDAAAALGIYLARCGRETPDPSLAVRHTVGRVQLQLVTGVFYVAATGEVPADGLRAALLGLAGAAIATVAADSGDLLAALPRDGLVAGSERLIRGPFGLQAVVTLGEGDVLRLQENGATAVAGEYLDATGARFSRIVADYSTVAAAGDAFATVRDTLDPYLTPIERSDVRLVFRDHVGHFGVVSRSGTRIVVLANLPAAP